MFNLKKISIPPELSHPFFFSEKEITVDLSNSKRILASGGYFYNELLFYNGIEANRPWNVPEQTLPQILEDWNHLKSHIEQLYRQRKKDELVDVMRKGIALFLQYLFWSNRKPVYLAEFPVHADLDIQPVNLKERAGFIMERPSLFHSYVQLCELMIEQEKLFAKNNIIRKASSKK